MVTVSVVAGGVYLWPQYVVKTEGTNGVWALLTTTGVALGVMTLQVLWVKMTKKTPYALMVRDTLGVVGLWVVMPVTGLFCLIIDGILLFLFGAMLHVFFYPMTPEIVMIGTIDVAAVWIGIRTLSTVARSIQFWFPIIMVSLAMILLFSSRDIRFLSSIVPTPTLVVPQWLRASLGTWFLYANGAVVASLAPHVRWPGRARPLLWTALAIGFQGSILLILFAITLATLGAPAVAQLQWPMIYVFSLVSVRTFFFKGIGMFVLITWASALVLYLAVHLFCFSWNIQAMVDASFRARRWIVVAAGAVVFGIAVLIPSSIKAEQLLFGLMNPVDLSWSLGVLMLSVMVAWIRRRRSKSQ